VLGLNRSFNSFGELDSEQTEISGQNIYSYALTRDKSGSISTKTETIGGIPIQYAYTYDSLGRLTSVSQNGLVVEEYQYGPNGTRTYEQNALRGIPGRTLSYSEEDHLLTAEDTSYQYDVDGFLTARTQGGQTTLFNYSSRGELLSVAFPDGRLIEYVYDPLGRRIAKKLNGTIVEKYLWQGRTRLLAVYDVNDALLMRFQYADSRMPLAMTKDGINYYLSYDQVGSLRTVADTLGNVVKELDYDSFGNVLSDSDPAFAVPFSFAGGLFDPDTGLVRFGARDYDPDTGRWAAKDPILFKGGDTNLYGYVLNDPVNWVDPLGLSGWAIDAGGAYGTGWGGSSNSSSGMAGTGFYIGATGPTNYAEIGAFTYQGTGVVTGAEIGVGYTLTRYNIDAKDFFQGTLDYVKTDFFGVSYTKYYDSCGKDVGWSLSLGGRGIGFSDGTGTVQGVQGALQ
jgi:RHS repeat-associated protein